MLPIILRIKLKLNRNHHKKSEPTGLKVIKPNTGGLFSISNKI